MLTLEALHSLTGGRLGTIDAPCPACGPDRRDLVNRRRRVLRIWAAGDSFATYLCVRCGVSGWARSETVAPIDRRRLEAARDQAAQRDAEHANRQRAKAAWLYRQAGPPRLAPNYLAARGITCRLPATMRELPPLKSGQHSAIVMPFGMATESDEPGVLSLRTNPIGIHLTLLAPDGSSKAGTGRDKLMLGASAGLPLVCAGPASDGLGLAISEGVEDALSVHQATGLAAWAAGAASRLPALAERVPAEIELVTIVADDDEAGRGHAAALADRLDARGIENRTIELGDIQ